MDTGKSLWQNLKVLVDFDKKIFDALAEIESIKNSLKALSQQLTL